MIDADPDKLKARLTEYQPATVDRDGLRPAGLLVPVLPGSRIVFIRRPQTMSRHAGQIAFPGGLADPEDPDILATALREAREEVGLQDVQILGQLDEVWTPTGFRLVPFVAWADDPQLVAAPGEVEEILTVSVVDLTRPGVFREEYWERQGKTYRVVFFELAGATIWGATGRVLLRLLQVAFGWAEAGEHPWESPA